MQSSPRVTSPELLGLPDPVALGPDVLDGIGLATRIVLSGMSSDIFRGMPADRLRYAAALRVAQPAQEAEPSVSSRPAGREHDAYFSVRRVSGPPAELFVRGLVTAHLEAPLDVVGDVEESEFDDSTTALFEGFRLVLGLAGLPDPDPAMPDPAFAPSASEIWMSGHRLFFTMIAGATVGLAHATLHASDPDRADEGVRFASAFLRSSAAAMRLAARFDPLAYVDTVRPDMLPPKVSPGFSGLSTVDHRALVAAMEAWRAAQTARTSTAAARELVNAVTLVYRSHEYVCARFRGNEIPSLRSEALAASATTPTLPPTGVALAREFTRVRVASVSP